MTTKHFSVHSSDGLSVYSLVVEWNAGELYVSCDCKAGSVGDWCRHKNSLLNGEEAILAVKEDLTDVLQWLKASPAYAAISEIHLAESHQKDAELLLKKAKSKVKAAKRAAASLVKPVVQK